MERFLHCPATQVVISCNSVVPFTSNNEQLYYKIYGCAHNCAGKLQENPLVIIMNIQKKKKKQASKLLLCYLHMVVIRLSELIAKTKRFCLIVR